MTFRSELRDWLSTHVTDDVRAARSVTAVDLAVLRPWNAELADAGWAAPAWPSEYGGRDAGIDEQLAYFEEMASFEAPGPINAIGVANIAPAIMAHGTDAQKAQHLRPLLRGDQIWSQGMSEPDAGSDLASLRTSAVLDGDDFVINGQKTWNSLGHLADWCQLYVRTDPAAPKHKGISCLLVDLRTRGVSARPITTMSGDHTFSELFFADARVPREALLGPLNEGWRVAMTTLSHERAGVARMHLALTGKLERLLAEPAVRQSLREPVARQRVAGVYSDIACMRWMTDRVLAAERTGRQPSSSSGSLAKLAWARIDQTIAEIAIDLLGPASITGGADQWEHNFTASRSTSIAGGTTEVNKSIVAEHGLGLPRA